MPAWTCRSRSPSTTPPVRSGHPFAGTTHLLAGILRDRDGPAARLLRGLGADPEAIFEQTSVRPD
ncbi:MULTISPECIES: Clp protease N-terminal domain-containing protein [unclassified Micromonospora]|uniref:Clp protease N-terminal domain-containing protein n=1 Tax=unclassified Micromonospora TaxID=2617518 RepID=UPI003A87E1C4